MTKNSVVYWGEVFAAICPGFAPHFLLVTQVLGNTVGQALNVTSIDTKNSVSWSRWHILLCCPFLLNSCLPHTPKMNAKNSQQSYPNHKSRILMTYRGLLEMLFCSLKVKGEDCQKVLTRYKQSFGGIRSKVMSETKFTSF